MNFTIDMGYAGWTIVILGALLFGAVSQLVGRSRYGYEWPINAVAAFIGALGGSEFVVDWRKFEPVYDGLALWPALLIGLLVGIVVAVVTRYFTGGSYFGGEAAA